VAITTKLRWLQVLEDYRHAHKQLGFVDEMVQAAAPEFQAYYEQFCQDHNIDLNALETEHKQKLEEVYGRTPEPINEDPVLDEHPPLPPPPGAMALYEGVSPETEPEVVNWSKEEKEIYEIFARLFRKIAIVIHPDKLSEDLSVGERERLKELFHHTKDALEKRKYFIVLEVAEELEIDLPKNYKQQIRWLKQEIKTVRDSMDQQKRTYNYMFAETETDEERDTLMEGFLHQLFGLVFY